MTVVSRYLDHLPMLYRADPLLGELLRAFECVLTGGEPSIDGLEQTIGELERFVRPHDAPSEFLPWLAGWFGLTLRHDWTESQRRDLIAHARWLYDRRGTAAGLQRFLELGLAFAGPVEVTVENPQDGEAGFFSVRVNPGTGDTDKILHITRVAHWILDRERPAHTWYRLRVSSPGMRIANDPKPENPGIRVGRTLLGSADDKP